MRNDQTFGIIGVVTGAGGLFAAASCCVLPLALASVGVSAAGLASLGPLHTPLSALALLAMIAGWVLYARRRRACASGEGNNVPTTASFALLVIATLLVAAAAVWPLIEAPLMAAFE